MAPRRVLIFSADIGEGHATAARALARGLQATGVEVHVEDDLGSLGRLNRLVLRDGSRALFRWTPWLYDLLYRALVGSSLARRAAAGSLRRFGARPLLRRIKKHRPDVIVSTYPGVTVVLGSLRRQGRLAIPAVATITDLAGLFFWAHPGMDLHLAAWEESLEETRRVAGGAAVEHIGPLTSLEFYAERTSCEARTALELPLDRPVVVVSGGGWGVGNLEAAVRTAVGVDAAIVVCVTAHNERVRLSLERAFAGRPDVRILGFTDQMSDLLAAADVLVHATGGVTVLEASLRDCPVVIYGFSTGHVRHNAEALEAHGLARRARTTEELGAVLRELVAAPARAAAPPTHVNPTELVLAARAARAPVGRRYVAPVRRTSFAAVAGVAALLSTGTGFSLAARGLDLDPLTHIPTDRPAVALVVDAPPAAIAPVAAELQRLHATASFAVVSAPARGTVAEAGRAGLELVPKLAGGEPIRWIATAKRLSATRRALGLPARFRYLMPRSDFTFGQYLIAHRNGGEAMAGGVMVSSAAELSSVHRGDVVELNASGSPARVAQQVEASVLALRSAGLEPSTVAGLAG
ncbi:MAG: processive 1,2-diacylglycerol beta-glucosyltransferase [Thermoleophilaceae bacterium]|nr:processive 1,2-diacylglycerol beta-glucosyltransferase [Thermoleophilaceae bacterium]